MLNIKEDKALKNKKEAMKYFSNDLESISALLSQYYPLELLKMACWEERRVASLNKKDPLLLLSRRLLPFLMQSILQSTLYTRGKTFSVNRDIKQKDWERLLNLSYDAAKRLAWYLENHVALLFKDESLNKKYFSELRGEVFNQFFASPVNKEEYEISKEMIGLLLTDTDEDTKELFNTSTQNIIDNFILLSDYSYDAIDKLQKESKEFKTTSELLIKLRKQTGDTRSNQEILKDVIIEQKWESWVKRLTDERDEFDLYKVEIPMDLNDEILQKFSSNTGEIDFDEYFNEGFIPSYFIPFVTFHNRYYSFVSDYITRSFPFIALKHYAKKENSFELNDQIAKGVTNALKQMLLENDTIDVYSYHSQKIDAIFLPSLKYVNAYKNPKSFALQVSFREEVMAQKAKPGHKLLIIDADNFDKLKKINDNVFTISAAALYKTANDESERRYFYVEVFGEDSPEENDEEISDIFDDDVETNPIIITETNDDDLSFDDITDEIEYDEIDEDEEAEKLASELEKEDDDIDFENNVESFNTTKFETEEEKEDYFKQFEQIDEEENPADTVVMDEIFENDDYEFLPEEVLEDDIFENTEDAFDFDDIDYEKEETEIIEDDEIEEDDIDPEDDYSTEEYVHDPYFQTLMQRQSSKDDPQLSLFDSFQAEEEDVKTEVEILNIDDDEIFIEDEEVESLEEDTPQVVDTPQSEEEPKEEPEELTFEDDEFSDEEEIEEDDLESIDEILEEEIFDEIEEDEEVREEENSETEENTEEIYDEDLYDEEEEYDSSDLANEDGITDEELLEEIEDDVLDTEDTLPTDTEEDISEDDLEEILNDVSPVETEELPEENEILEDTEEDELENILDDVSDEDEILEDDETEESLFDIDEEEVVEDDEDFFEEELEEETEEIDDSEDETIYDIEDNEEEISEEDLEEILDDVAEEEETEEPSLDNEDEAITEEELDDILDDVPVEVEEPLFDTDEEEIIEENDELLEEDEEERESESEDLDEETDETLFSLEDEDIVEDDEDADFYIEDPETEETEDDLYDYQEEVEEVIEEEPVEEEIVEEPVEEVAACEEVKEDKENIVKPSFLMKDFSDDNSKSSKLSIRPEYDSYPVMVSQILSRLYPKTDGSFFNFVNDVEEGVLNSFVNAVRESWKVQLQDGKDKMFSIADYSLSIILALPKHNDDLRKEELLNNAGAVMYSKKAKEWNALIISLGVEGSIIEASEVKIDQSSFSSSNWKIVTVIGEQLLSRERNRIR